MGRRLGEDLTEVAYWGHRLPVEQLAFLAASDARPAGTAARLVDELLAEDAPLAPGTSLHGTALYAGGSQNWRGWDSALPD